MKKLHAHAGIACLLLLAACSNPAPEAPANAVTNETIVVPVESEPSETPNETADIAGAVGKWVDDENDTYSFVEDGSITSAGQVSMTGNWTKAGDERYEVDLNSPVGLSKGVACVYGDTMAMRIGDGTITLLGRVGADGKPAAVDKSATCD